MAVTTTPDVPVPQYRYVPREFDPTDLESLRGLVKELLERELGSAADLEQWVVDWNEIEASVWGARQRRKIAMTCDTGDPELKQAHLDYERDVFPEWERLSHRLKERYTGSEWRASLGSRYEIFDKRIATQVEIFTEKNAERRAVDQLLYAQYAEMNGRLTATLRGEKLTLTQARGYLEESDRATRAEAFQAIAAARLSVRDETDDLFDEMLALRGEIAKDAGFDNYADYVFAEKQRFDYTAGDCFTFHDAVETVVVPALAERAEHRRRTLSLDALRPYDTMADLHGITAHPFGDQEGYTRLGRELFDAVSPVFAQEFDILIRNRLLDLMSRPGKAPGGYNSTLADIRLPFIFANGSGRQRDIVTLLHEGGHAFHSLLTREEPVMQIARPPMEFCEVASMAMELFGLEHFEEVFSRDEARAAAAALLQQRLTVLAWVATIDAFQHWLYTHPGHSREERTAKWLEVRARFGPEIDWSGFEDVRACEWHGQLHLFASPFYYIEYAIADIGALQVWKNYRDDPAETVACYRRALALGGGNSLPDLFATAGARFAMDEPVIREVVDDLMAALRALD